MKTVYIVAIAMCIGGCANIQEEYKPVYQVKPTVVQHEETLK